VSTSYTAGAVSPFDIPSIQHSIDATMATLSAEERGNLIISAKRGDGVKAALLVRGPSIGSLHTEAIAWVTAPLLGKTFDWGAQGRVSWLYGQTVRPKPVLFSRLRGWYAVLRDYNSPRQSALKALLLCLGIDVKVRG
jgi:hypothetical protein